MRNQMDKNDLKNGINRVKKIILGNSWGNNYGK
jgi:hypothetical protein